jgi:cellulose synthase (UDP-forming)
MSLLNPTTINLWLPSLVVVAFLLGSGGLPLRQEVRLLLRLGLVGLGCRYWYWRTTTTLQFAGMAEPVWGWGLYGLELVVWLSLWVNVLQTLGGSDRGLRQLGDRCEAMLREQPNPPSVDLFILADRQPECRIRRAMMACQSLRYGQRQIYVLDLDDRAPMRALVESLGGTYVAAPVPEWQVSTLLNSALRQSEGELIAVLTAAMMPLPQFLERTVGWFAQSAIAWVQTPLPGLVPDRQVQCESGYVVRRSRLEMVGGYFSAGTLPGYQTLLRLVLHGETWVSIQEPLMISDQAESPIRSLSRRLQWLQGNWEIQQQPLAFPLSSRLSRSQWLCLANQWLEGWQPLWQLVGWLVPIVALGVGILPGRGSGLDWLAYFGPFWVMAQFLPNWLAQRRRGGMALADWRAPVVAAMLCGPGLQRLGQLLIQDLRQRWAGSSPWQSAMRPWAVAAIDGPPSLRSYALRQRWIGFGLIMLLLSLGAIGWDVGMRSGLLAERWPLHLWAGYNAVMLVLALRSLSTVGESPVLTVQPLHLPCRFWVAGEKWPGRTLALSEQGAWIQLLPQAFPLETLPEVLTIELGRPVLQLDGRVVETRRDRGQLEIQVAFQSLTLDQQQQLLWLLYPPESGETPRPLRPWAMSRR